MQDPVRHLTEEQLQALYKLAGDDNVLRRPSDLLTYDCDGTTLEKFPPAAVVFVHSTSEVQRLVKWCNAQKLPFCARGAGTGLSGGALALQGGIIIELSRMTQILEVDFQSGIAIVEPGLVNLFLTRHIAERGYYYAPDPSSQSACTIGGNVAENSGGPHTLKYGVTTNHVLGLEVVLPDGELINIGGDTRHYPGYDLTGLFIGSEGTFGIATKITVRILRNPQSATTLLGSFATIRDASQTVSDITAAGMIPAALELIDGFICRAVEQHLKIGLPEDAGAVLLIELDGVEAGQNDLAERITEIGNRNNALSMRIAADAKERAALWKARKGAFGAVGLISPSYYTHDGVIPRSKLPEVLERIDEIVKRHELRVANVFHAGDGNLHPLLLFDDRDPAQIEHVHKAGEEILRVCVDVGGSLSGEHGIGFEKINAMRWLFDEASLGLMNDVRTVFNPDNLCNPGKVVPTPGRCADVRKPMGAKRYA
jgi:glycolate oxidase